MVSILSIDGGGIRGIIPCAFLVEFEKRTGKPISELFDLIAGTSTGGILAAMLTVPDRQGRAKYTAEQVYSAYLEHGPYIFHQGPLRSVISLRGFARPRYSPKALELMLEKYLGKARLHSTLSEILVTAYDISSSTPWFFKTSFAKKHPSPEDDPLLTQVVRATTAAPTYFPPLEMEGHCMIDGGVYAANPALCAYAQARNMYPDEKDFLVVSLGTGEQEHERPCSKVKNWGIAQWAAPIVTVAVNSSSASVNYQMRALVGSENYERFQVLLDKDSAAMDDADEKNIQRLQNLSNAAIMGRSGSIDRLCRTLSQKDKIRPAHKIYKGSQS